MPLQRETIFFLYDRKDLPVILPLSRTGIALCDHSPSRPSRKKHEEKAANETNQQTKFLSLHPRQVTFLYKALEILLLLNLYPMHGRSDYLQHTGLHMK